MAVHALEGDWSGCATGAAVRSVRRRTTRSAEASRWEIPASRRTRSGPGVDRVVEHPHPAVVSRPVTVRRTAAPSSSCRASSSVPVGHQARRRRRARRICGGDAQAESARRSTTTRSLRGPRCAGGRAGCWVAARRSGARPSTRSAATGRSSAPPGPRSVQVRAAVDGEGGRAVEAGQELHRGRGRVAVRGQWAGPCREPVQVHRLLPQGVAGGSEELEVDRVDPGGGDELAAVTAGAGADGISSTSPPAGSPSSATSTRRGRLQGAEGEAGAPARRPRLSLAGGRSPRGGGVGRWCSVSVDPGGTGGRGSELDPEHPVRGHPRADRRMVTTSPGAAPDPGPAPGARRQRGQHGGPGREDAGRRTGRGGSQPSTRSRGVAHEHDEIAVRGLEPEVPVQRRGRVVLLTWVLT